MANPIDDFFKAIANTIVGGGVQAYGAVADRSQMPSNKRLYLETFADKNQMPITEKNFTQAELNTIGELIKAKQLANPNAPTGYIQYKDYVNFVPASQNSLAAGVSAGIDMSLVLAERIFGQAFAEKMQLDMEYDPKPPFNAGHPRSAPAEVHAELRGLFDSVLKRD